MALYPESVIRFARDHEMAVRRTLAGMFIVGAIGGACIRGAENFMTLPAFDRNDPHHMQLAEKFKSACASANVFQDQVTEAFNTHFQTGAPAVITLDPSSFDSCVTMNAQKELLAAKPENSWLNYAFYLAIGLITLPLLVAATMPGAAKENNKEDQDPPLLSPEI